MEVLLKYISSSNCEFFNGFWNRRRRKTSWVSVHVISVLKREKRPHSVKFEGWNLHISFKFEGNICTLILNLRGICYISFKFEGVCLFMSVKFKGVFAHKLSGQEKKFSFLIKKKTNIVNYRLWRGTTFLTTWQCHIGN